MRGKLRGTDKGERSRGMTPPEDRTLGRLYTLAGVTWKWTRTGWREVGRAKPPQPCPPRSLP